MSKRKPTNPFYILLLLAASAFAITACAYGVMTVRQLAHSRTARWKISNESVDNQSFDTLVDRHGAKLLIAELALLGIGTVGAIAYDQYLDGKKATPLTVDNEGSTEEHA